MEQSLMAWIPLTQVVSAIQTSLSSASDPTTGFAVSELKVDLPAEILTLGGQVVVQLPGQMQKVETGKLARLSFTIGATAPPEAKGPPSPWTRAYTGTFESLYAVAVSGERTLVAGKKGTLLESKDSGTSFLPIALGTSERLHAVAISGNGYALVAGNKGLLWRRASPDSPFLPLDLGVGTSLNAVATWGNVAVVGGAGGHVFMSVDDGQSWNPLGSVGNNVHGLWGPSSDAVFVVCANGAVWKMDQGKLVQLSSGVQRDLYGIWGTGPNNVYVVGHGGLILQSTDGGSSFHALVSGTTENLYSVWGTGPGNILVAGRKGTILRSADGTSFAPLAAGVTDALHAVASTPKGDMLLTGTSGLVLSYRALQNQ
jgi:photosystem II stability/assembly factor-like uncharacterized protein